MKINVRYVDDIAIVSPEGKININSSKLIESVGSLLESGVRKIILNISNVDFVDYNGLSVLAITYKSVLNQKGILILCGISLHILELLRIVKLDEVFEIYETVAEAISKLKQKEKMTKADILEQPLRRRFERLEIDIPVTYRLSRRHNVKGADQIYSGRVANLSGAGLFIRTMDLLPPGSEVDMEITLEKHKKPRSLEGVVIWAADKGLQPDLYPGIGVQFMKLTPRLQEEIIGFIERNIIRRKE